VVSIDYVTIGNADSAKDASGNGDVAYAYQIAKNETTISQYADFLISERSGGVPSFASVELFQLRVVQQPLFPTLTSEAGLLVAAEG